MTTARERYEAKTRVVTFRVHQEVFDQLEEVKARAGLSNADLIKLGAGIAREEIRAKLAEESGLQDRLAELKVAVEKAQQRVSEFIEEERSRRLGELDAEMQAFKLFDQGWRTEQVSFKLAIPQRKAEHFFDEWAKQRGEKQAAETELIRRCLRMHVKGLQEQRMWIAFSPRPSDRQAMVELGKQIGDCQRLLANPCMISKEDKEFLIAEYWSKSSR